MYGKYKLKIQVLDATFSTRCHKEYTSVMDVLILSDPWSFFIMAIVKENTFTGLDEHFDISK